MKRMQRIQSVLGITILNMFIFGVLPNLLSTPEHITYTIVLLLAGVGAYLLLTVFLRRSERRARTSLILEQENSPGPAKGLIVLMSPGDRITPAENAVRAHLDTLVHCWVISGSELPGEKYTSKQNAEALRSKHQEASGSRIHFHLKELQNEDDPRETYHVVQSIYEEAKGYQLAEEEIIADYTGGKKGMTAGMVLACSTANHRNVEYLKALETTPEGTAKPSSQVIPIRIDVHFGESRE